MAGLIATGTHVFLVVPALADLYHGLSSIVSCEGGPGNSNVEIASHYYSVWAGEYFANLYPNYQQTDPAIAAYLEKKPCVFR